MAMTQRERTIAIAAGGIVGAALLYSVVLDPLLTRLDEADRLLTATTAELDAANSLRDRRTRDAREWKTIAGTRVPTDGSSAESQLLNRVSEAAQRAGLKIEGTQRRPAERERGFERIQRSVNAVGSMAQISRFLYALQTSDIPLRIVDLNINAKKDGGDELELTLGVMTLVNSPAPAGRVAGAGRSGREVLQ